MGFTIRFIRYLYDDHRLDTQTDRQTNIDIMARGPSTDRYNDVENPYIDHTNLEDTPLIPQDQERDVSKHADSSRSKQKPCNSQLWTIAASVIIGAILCALFFSMEKRPA